MDQVVNQYCKYLKSEVLNIIELEISQNRIRWFFKGKLNIENYQLVDKVMRRIFTLSHEQAAAKHGFSINKINFNRKSKVQFFVSCKLI